jgi:hypothetical protein
VFGDDRRAVVVGGVIVFAVGLLVGFLVGRAGREELRAEGPLVPTLMPSPTSTVTGSPPVVTPSPGQEPAITNQGQVLREGDRPVVNVTATASCQSLVTPGLVGECGEVPVADTRVVWVVQRSTTADGSSAFEARLFTFVPDAGGWVEWLQASDPAAELWSDVNVLPADLTGDGVAELVVGFRGLDERLTLEYDVVGYGENNLPQVLAHPNDAPRGAVVIAGGQIQAYAAQYPNDEPACCPPSFLRRIIAFEDGFFRVIGSETVVPNVVPSSQL